jgi:hypothetical protein
MRSPAAVMQSPEETLFEERIAALIMPLDMARYNRKWDSAPGAIAGAQVNDVYPCKNRTFCCGAGDGCFWKDKEKDNRLINH